MEDYHSGPLYRCLILTLVGSNLESLLRSEKLHRLLIKTVLVLAIQLVTLTLLLFPKTTNHEISLSTLKLCMQPVSRTF